jgi:probable rRNA maturation factor
MPRPDRVRLSWKSGRPPAELDSAVLRRALAAFLERLGHGGRTLSVLFTDDADLRTLNRRFGAKDRVTDVLSWPYQDGGPDNGDALGDVALSLERAQAQARRNGWDLQTEVLRLLAHGCAHLAGYDHHTPAQERKMLKVEKQLLDNEGLRGIYPPGRGGNRSRS